MKTNNEHNVYKIKIIGTYCSNFILLFCFIQNKSIITVYSFSHVSKEQLGSNVHHTL